MNHAQSWPVNEKRNYDTNYVRWTALQDEAYNALWKWQGDNNAGVGNSWPIGPSIFSGALGPE